MVDQFEELFSQVKDASTRDAFIGHLKALRADPRCTVIMTMRADFYGDLMNSPLWPIDQSQIVEVVAAPGRIVAAGDRQAGRGGGRLPRRGPGRAPARRRGRRARFVADAPGGPGAALGHDVGPPTDPRLVRHPRPRRPQRTGRGDGHQGRRHPRRPDRPISSGSPGGSSCDWSSSARAAPTPAASSASTTSAPNPTSPGVFDDLLQHLIANRLLTPSTDEARGLRVDIAHEMLIVGWPASREWVEARRDAEKTRRRLVAKAEEWVRLGRGESGLLDPAELAEADPGSKSGRRRSRDRRRRERLGGSEPPSDRIPEESQTMWTQVCHRRLDRPL